MPSEHAPPSQKQQAVTRNLGGEGRAGELARQHGEGAAPAGTAARNLNASHPPSQALAAVNAPASGRVLRNPAFANRSAVAGPQGRAFARATFQGRFADRIGGQWWHDRRFRPTVIGWFGPLFWPYAYDDFIDYTFYPYAYDTFWPYAYDDLYDGMFGRYAYGIGTAYAAVGRPQQSAGGGRTVAADVCSGRTAGLTDWPITEIAQTVEPDGAQRAALDEVKDATAQALAILRAAGPSELPSTPTGRIEAMHTRLAAMLQAVRIVRPALEKFYQSLNDEQKARFNALGPGDEQDQPQVRQDLTQVCNERASGIASLPIERMERAVRPDDAKRVAFSELQNAMSAAVDLLKSNCPTYRALTPVARLEVMEQRLDAMLRAVETVQPALEKFYSSLSDKQKERFNRLNPGQG